MPALAAAPAPRFTMTEGSPAPPTVTVSLEPGSCSPPLLKTKRTLLSTLKHSPSMLRRRMKPPHLNHCGGRNSWDSADSPSAPPPPSSSSPSFTGKEFHVCYQGRVRVTTLQVSEAMNAVKKLAPELITVSPHASSASSSNEDLLSAALASSQPLPASSPATLTLPLTASPTFPAAVPRSPRLARSPKAFHKSCCLSISKQCVCIDDEVKFISETIAIAAVAYCATDLRYPRAVALIHKAHTSVLMCHVFVCSSREKAEKIVAFIGRAFQSAWQDWKSIHEPSAATTLLISPNNNHEHVIRGRSRSYDHHLGTSPGGSPVEKTTARYSSYDLRGDDFSSSPDDD